MCVLSSSVFATEASKYLEKQYSDSHYGKNTHITVKKEHTEEYRQKIGEQVVPAITYGYGDLKVKKSVRKKRKEFNGVKKIKLDKEENVE